MCAIQADTTTEKEEEGVTVGLVEVDSSEFVPPRQLSLAVHKEHFRKMAMGNPSGPRPSGEVKPLYQLNLQDCRDIRDVINSFNVTKNEAVLACCLNLDEQEGQGLLAADLLGIELVRGEEVPNEAHKVGLQIDTLLRDTKEADEKLKSAVRQCRTRARKGTDVEKKLTAIEFKLKHDREDLWAGAHYAPPMSERCRTE